MSDKGPQMSFFLLQITIVTLSMTLKRVLPTLLMTWNYFGLLQNEDILAH